MEKKNMTTKTKKPVKKSTTDLELMHKTISNLTNVVSTLQADVKRIKIRMGI
jgi:thiamine pyrophosphokinase|tara:strand:- start:1898 stop:2053 length:156 start_codon:yes stop_codon:yes gene_type:complete